MTIVPTCLCGHAQQIHEPPDGTRCRGRCDQWGFHFPDDHDGACTARCICERYRPKTVSQDRPPHVHHREALAPCAPSTSPIRPGAQGGGRFHASDINHDQDNPNCWWGACACGWIQGPFSTQHEASATWVDHVAAVINA